MKIDAKKELAKVGMVTSMAVVVGSAFFLKRKMGKEAHVISGALLVGFSIWHHLLYQPSRASKKEVTDVMS